VRWCGFLNCLRWRVEIGAAQPPTEWHGLALPPGWFGTPPPGGPTTPQKPQ
jgi:hypothetical protein